MHEIFSLTHIHGFQACSPIASRVFCYRFKMLERARNRIIALADISFLYRHSEIL